MQLILVASQLDNDFGYVDGFDCDVFMTFGAFGEEAVFDIFDIKLGDGFDSSTRVGGGIMEHQANSSTFSFRYATG